MSPDRCPGKPLQGRLRADLRTADLLESLRQMFPPDWLRQTARDTNVVKRERKVDPAAMFWVLVLSFGVRLQRTLASLKRSYEKQAKTRLSDGSWYERFTPELVRFLKACVQRGIEHLAQEASRSLSERLHRFQDVLIQDSTVVRLHAKLAKKWPATRTRRVAAGVKVATLISAVANGPKSVAIHGERTSEIRTLRVGPWVKDRILLIDLGFYKHQLFARIAENEGFFVTRLKESADPMLLASLRVHRGQAIELAGQRWSTVEPRLKREVLDAHVELSFARRRYGGSRSPDTMEARLVAVYNAEASRYHVYLTNIPPEVLEPEEIAALYGARWDIELVFKELKSRYALDLIKTTNPQIVEALIWVAILTLLVSRRLHNLIRLSAPHRRVVRYTQLRWATIFAENADMLLTAVLRSNGIENTLDLIASVYMSQALDPHVNRRRFRDPWWA